MVVRPVVDPVSCVIAPSIDPGPEKKHHHHDHAPWGKYRRGGQGCAVSYRQSLLPIQLNWTVLLGSLLCFRLMILLLVIHLFLPIDVAALAAHPSPRRTPTTDTYAAARSIRLNQGHDAAVLSYQKLMRDNPGDCTAATRIAASPSAPMRHDLACPVIDTDDDIANLRQLLNSSGYNRMNVGKLFGVVQGESDGWSGDELRNLYPWGPSYITPVEAGSTKQQPPLPSNSGQMKSLTCLVSMFVLGFAVHRTQLEEHLIGGGASIELLEVLGLAFPCDIDPSLVVPYCHLFPMDVPRLGNDGMESIVLATDLHPAALSRTTVGTKGNGAVMYIGPDSLALVQHLPLDQLHQLEKNKRERSRGHRILDLCAGSGVQAISALAGLREISPTSKAMCVDINERALRFTKFNSMLNGMGDRVEIVKGDLIERRMLPLLEEATNQTPKSDSLVPALRSHCLRGEGGGDSKEDDLFDIVLANPPFIPVPLVTTDDTDPGHTSSSASQAIDLRYGLFSSGGADGEAVLKSILEMSPKLVHSCGFVGIVSEFMNPSESLCLKIEQWWNTEGSEDDEAEFDARGILFTNQEAIDAATYAERRSDDDSEYHIWISHLNKCCITSISPGLLFIQRRQQAIDDSSNRNGLSFEHVLVPKSAKGSIWTPQNSDAIRFTQRFWMVDGQYLS